MKRRVLILILLLFPVNVLAYSNKLIIPGKPVGIEIKSSGVYIVDFYKVDGEYIAKKNGFKVGDIITKVNDNKINSIDDLNSIITKTGPYNITVNRNGKIVNKTLDVIKENNLITTGLYVKDTINGIGTLSYIDPETKIFASLGHEVIESSTSDKFMIKDGNILVNDKPVYPYVLVA